MLAQERDFQIVYREELVEKLRCQAVAGEFTLDEALTRLLSGTGLTFHHLDENTVTVVPIAQQGLRSGAGPPARTKATAKAIADDRVTAGPVAAIGAEQIVVTAQKRSERLQDVPASIGVLTGQFLQDTAAGSFQDYLPSVAGVSFYQNAAQTNAIFIRGVSGGVNLISTSTTGVYIDEAPVTQSIGGIVDLNPFDVQRVEVLRGPQGTLYGAESMGGTIRLIMNKPQPGMFAQQFQTRVSDTEHGGASYEANAMLNIPVADAVAVRLVGGFRSMSGYVDEVALGQKDANFEQVANLLAAARWQPVTQADVLFTVIHQDVVYGAHPEAFVGPQWGPYQGGRPYRESGHQPFTLAGLTVNYDFGPVTFTSASNYYHKRSEALRDITSNLLPMLPVPATTTGTIAYDLVYDAESFSQEARLASNTHSAIHWLVGGFYAGGKGPNLSAKTLTDITVLQSVDIYTAAAPQSQHQIAAFGEATAQILRSTDITAGLRFSHYGNHAVDHESGISIGGVIDSDSGASAHFLDQRYSLTHHFSNEQLLYIQAASGSRQGGPSGAAGLPQSCTLGLESSAVPALQTHPDSLWTYELGSKGSYAEGRLIVDGSIYFTKWHDIQSTVALPCGVEVGSNAGAATIRGAELEMSARPVDGLTVAFGAALTDSHLTEGNVSVGALHGDPLPLVPQVSGMASARYEFPLLQRVRGFINAAVQYTGHEYSDFLGRPDGFRIPAHINTNARMGVTTNHFDLSIYGTNLLDERIVTFVADSPVRETLARPRTIGLDFVLRP